MAIAVVTGEGRPTPPCGACRQVLQEFAPGLTVLLAGAGGPVEEWTLADLLPRAFTTFERRRHAARRRKGVSRGGRALG